MQHLHEVASQLQDAETDKSAKKLQKIKPAAEDHTLVAQFVSARGIALLD